MRAAIMQPYFMPYIGYWQLLNFVDVFVIYDDIQYTKKGWINRNRILVNGKPEYISIPIKSDSDYLNVNQREISPEYHKQRQKIKNKIRENYRKSPEFSSNIQIIDGILDFDENNLFSYIFNSVREICSVLSIKTQIVKSSTLNFDRELKSQDKVIAICQEMGVESYVNPIGGLELYDVGTFQKEKIKLEFLKPQLKPYNQQFEDFIPALSIIDPLMRLSKSNLQTMLNNEFEIIK